MNNSSAYLNCVCLLDALVGGQGGGGGNGRRGDSNYPLCPACHLYCWYSGCVNRHDAQLTRSIVRHMDVFTGCRARRRRACAGQLLRCWWRLRLCPVLACVDMAVRFVHSEHTKSAFPTPLYGGRGGVSHDQFLGHNECLML